MDLDALLGNYRAACAMTDAAVSCVLKANAYGHGLLPVARTLQEAGCRHFAVSCVREALCLRRGGIGGEIHVMAPAEPEETEDAVRSGVTLTASSNEDLLLAEQAAVKTGCIADIHIKLDTGFHRLGFDCSRETARKLGRILPSLTHVRAAGLFSHLGLVNQERDEEQHRKFTAMRELLREEGLAFSCEHLCDSIGLVRYPEWHMDRCRVGALLFGSHPESDVYRPYGIRETAALRAKVIRVMDVPAGETIGYDETPTDRPMRVAVIAAGYGDGYPRRLSCGRGKVLIHGKRVPVTGLVCMDQMMADVTELPECRTGDTATLLGGGIAYSEMAAWAETNRNECLTILSQRPVRRYWKDGRVVGEEDLLLKPTEVSF